MPKLYFEANIHLTDSTNFGDGGYNACLGLAGSSFQLDNPWPLDVNSTGPTVAEGIFWAFIFSTNAGGWGYPFRPAPGPLTLNYEDAIGLAVDTDAQLLWLRNSTQSPSSWFGDGVGTHDPVTGTGGYSFGVSGDSPITGDVFIAGGAARGSDSRPAASLSLNPGGPFAAAAPTGFHATASSLIWNPDDSSAHLVFSEGGLRLTAGSIPGSNNPTAFVRSTRPLGVSILTGAQMLAPVTQATRLIPVTQRVVEPTPTVAIEFDLFDGEALQVLRLANAGPAVRLQ